MIRSLLGAALAVIAATVTLHHASTAPHARALSDTEAASVWGSQGQVTTVVKGRFCNKNTDGATQCLLEMQYRLCSKVGSDCYTCDPPGGGTVARCRKRDEKDSCKWDMQGGGSNFDCGPMRQGTCVKNAFGDVYCDPSVAVGQCSDTKIDGCQ